MQDQVSLFVADVAFSPVISIENKTFENCFVERAANFTFSADDLKIRNDLGKVPETNELPKPVDDNKVTPGENTNNVEDKSTQSTSLFSDKTTLQMEEELKTLVSLNENLIAQLNDKEREIRKIEIETSDVKNILKQNDELKILNENLSVQIDELKNSENLARSDADDMKKELANLTVLNESLLPLNDGNVETKQSIEGMSPDINKLLKENQELKNANENLSSKIRELQNTENHAQLDAMESKNKLENMAAANESLLAQIKELQRFSSREHCVDPNTMTPDINKLRNENNKLKSTNEDLIVQINVLEEKLQNIENRKVESYLADTSSDKDMTSIDYNMKTDWMLANMKKLQSKNEKLKSANEKLLSQISDLQCTANRSRFSDIEMKNDSENLLETKENVRQESDDQLIFSSNSNMETEWMKTDMEKLKNKNEKLKIANESLVAEIGVLKSAEGRALQSTQQVERHLLRLSAINERLSAQLNDKKSEKKQFTRSHSLIQTTAETKELLKKIDELTSTNERLVAEIGELKHVDINKMKNDLNRMSSSNESLKLQISELKLLSGNDHNIEADWMAADMKKLLNKNKKLNSSNQNLVSEINELRRELKSMENRATPNSLQKDKELEKLTTINEKLTAQFCNQKVEKKNPKSQDCGLDTLAPDIKKIQKKNEELKAANEKLLSVIVSLKNSENVANAKKIEYEKELRKLQDNIKCLQDTNKYLQDTLENCVEKDWNKPKTELERICQLILNEGVGSITDSEYNYMCKWFGKSSIEIDVPKSSHGKTTSRKHCRICQQSLEPCSICDCRQLEGKFKNFVFTVLQLLILNYVEYRFFAVSILLDDLLDHLL